MSVEYCKLGADGNVILPTNRYPDGKSELFIDIDKSGLFINIKKRDLSIPIND